MGRITEAHVAVAIVTMVTVNVSGETNIPVTLMQELRTYTFTCTYFYCLVYIACPISV